MLVKKDLKSIDKADQAPTKQVEVASNVLVEPWGRTKSLRVIEQDPVQ